MTNNYKVYMHLNKINNKKYIGLTKQKCEERWREGRGYKTQPKFFRAILKYGWNNFDHIILYNNLTELQASRIEKQLIQQYDTINNGYNIDLGGSTTNHSPETLKKMRQSMLGKKHTQETKNKISQANGKKIICITTNMQYDSAKEASEKTGVDSSSIIRCCKGKQHTAGKMTWKYADIDLQLKYENANKNNIDKCKKPVFCITTGKRYESVREAAKDTNSDESNIIKVCKGKYKTTNNLKWRYINEE